VDCCTECSKQRTGLVVTLIFCYLLTVSNIITHQSRACIPTDSIITLYVTVMCRTVSDKFVTVILAEYVFTVC